jgi:uncharacterized protein YbjT (DUF2867 family)
MFVVAGVSGHTGSATADALLQGHHKVRVIVRDPAKAHSWAARGADVAVADLQDAAALAKALAGAKGVYALLPPNPSAPDPLAHTAALSASWQQALRTAQVPHVVVLSSIAAHLPAGTGPIQALHQVETQWPQAAPATSFTFLRPTYFMENVGNSLAALGAGVLPSFFPASFPQTMIATKDIGTVAARLLVEGPTTKRSVVELSGPSTTMNDVARALSAATGRAIHVNEAPVSAMAHAMQGFGMPEKTASLYQEMTQAIINGTVAFEGTHRTLIGTTTIDAVVKQLLA